MRKAKIIQIGLSGFGKSVGLSINRCRNIEFLGVYDMNTTVSDNFAGQLGIKSYHTLEEVLSSDCDGVILEVPNTVHLELAAAAAKAKKHVCVEKPITNTIEEAREMIRICREEGALLQVGHSSRFYAVCRRLKELLDSKTIGRIVLIEANYSSEKAKRISTDTWRSFKNTCPGGPMLQLGIHSIDNIFYLTGCKPVKIKGVFSDDFVKSDSDDAGMIIMKLEDETMVYIGSSYVSPLTNSTVIYGDNGKMEVGEDSIRIIKDGKEDVISVTEENEMDNFVRQYESFADCILTGKTPEVDGEAGLLNLEVILTALNS
jgi:predicted dehydrogenase